MVAKTKQYPSPKFRSVKEEEEYWKTHSPIVEGYEGEIKRPRQKRSSFLAVRLSGEELSGLRQLAAKQGLGPSTLARIILTSAMNQGDALPKQITPGELQSAIQSVQEKWTQPMKEKIIALGKDIAIGDPNDPNLILMTRNQIPQVEEAFWTFFISLLAALGVEVVTPEDERYKKLKRVRRVGEKVKVKQ